MAVKACQTCVILTLVRETNGSAPLCGTVDCKESEIYGREVAQRYSQTSFEQAVSEQGSEKKALYYSVKIGSQISSHNVFCASPSDN